MPSKKLKKINKNMFITDKFLIYKKKGELNDDHSFSDHIGDQKIFYSQKSDHLVTTW